MVRPRFSDDHWDRNGKFRGWIGTAFQDNPPTFTDACVWGVANPEICPDTGRFHWQWALWLQPGPDARLRYRQVQALINCPGCHLAPIMSTPLAAFNYCCKPETRAPGRDPVYFGERPVEEDRNRGQGRRNDLERMSQELLEGSDMKSVARSAPATWIRNYRGLAAFQALMRDVPDRNFKTRLEIHWGVPDSGKTHGCHARFAGRIYRKNKTTTRWDDYNHQECVLIDEFSPWRDGDRCLSLSDLCELADRYPMEVEGRGTGARWKFTSKIIYITSNKRPEEWWGVFTDISALLRRAEVVQEYKEPYRGPRADDEPLMDLPHPDRLRSPRFDRAPSPGFPVSPAFRPVSPFLVDLTEDLAPLL